MKYEMEKFIVTIIIGVAFGFFLGVSYPSLTSNKQIITSPIPAQEYVVSTEEEICNSTENQAQNQNVMDFTKIWVPSNPRGAERLPQDIVVSESDFYPRRLWGKPSEDLTSKPRYLVTFTVGYNQKKNIDAAMKKFSDNFTIILFHYDGRTSEWDDEFEWSRKAIHVSVNKQTKWWYAKRFLHPDIVAPYEYIFIWDEDLGVEQFDAEEYITLVKKHGLEVSQPGLEPHKEVGITWQMTKQIKGNSEVHKETTERPGWCWDPHQPPCAAFVEIMAPVFSRNAWRCTWYMIQNDLVHGWGLDFALQRCIEPPAHEKIGVVDAQPIVHQGIPSLSGKNSENGKSKRLEVKQRSRREWQMFQERIGNAEKAYLKSIGV
ncbi:uncharacterized protein LOC116026647 isoform X1 [Ipomoea triloba]|uniref:uncharacterized protein LOC116026647 isoform X1 n=1 Tax=Ipomoea triloba TaxID=35885 RepID=UPI00125E2A46|nr:uncharacterized protein LOC116026647 isoform X1 [Ipomoea triloba]